MNNNYYKNKSLKKSPNIIYVHISFYGFEKLNNWSKSLLFKLINVIVVVEYNNGKSICWKFRYLYRKVDEVLWFTKTMHFFSLL